MAVTPAYTQDRTVPVCTMSRDRCERCPELAHCRGHREPGSSSLFYGPGVAEGVPLPGSHGGSCAARCARPQAPTGGQSGRFKLLVVRWSRLRKASLRSGRLVWSLSARFTSPFYSPASWWTTWLPVAGRHFGDAAPVAERHFAWLSCARQRLLGRVML
jgi:hypothetical protein